MQLKPIRRAPIAKFYDHTTLYILGYYYYYSYYYLEQ